VNGNVCSPWELYDDAIALLKEQETQKFLVDETGKITPLPVVVRCKDCKKFTGDGKWCSEVHRFVTGDKYCSWAKRRNDNGNNDEPGSKIRSGKDETDAGTEADPV
jgi:hypothetical protein